MNRKTYIIGLGGLLLIGILVFYFDNSGEGPDRSLASFRGEEDSTQLKILREMGNRKGPEAVRSFLKKTYPDEPSDEHELAHVIGESAFLRDSYKGFAVCDSFMRFACYHGVILEAIRQNGYSAEIMHKLASGCLGLGKNMTTITACAHGIGHGIMWVRSYDLLASYQECETMFQDEKNRFFCYDGVSMENVVRRSDQKVGQIEDELKSKGPFYPCNEIPFPYRPACVREHLHLVRRFFYDFDTMRSSEYCLHFEDDFSRRECFGALGSALNQDFPDRPEYILSECKKVIPQYQEHCIGVAATQYSFGHQFEKGRLLCNALSEPQRTGCLNSVESARLSL